MPIVPVAIAGPFEALPTGRAIPRPFRPIEVTFRPPVHPGELSYASLAEKVGDAVGRQAGKFYEEKG